MAGATESDNPDGTPDNPDETPANPGEIPDNPDEISDNPDETPDNIDETPDNPDQVPVNPDAAMTESAERSPIPRIENPILVKLDNPDRNPDNSDKSPDNPNETRDNPDENPDNPDTVMDESADQHPVPQTENPDPVKPDNPDEMVDRSENPDTVMAESECPIPVTVIPEAATSAEASNQDKTDNRIPYSKEKGCTSKPDSETTKFSQPDQCSAENTPSELVSTEHLDLSISDSAENENSHALPVSNNQEAESATETAVSDGEVFSRGKAALWKTAVANRKIKPFR